MKNKNIDMEDFDSEESIQSIIQHKALLFVDADPNINNMVKKLVILFIKNHEYPIIMTENYETGVLIGDRTKELIEHIVKETKKLGEFDLSLFTEMIFRFVDENFYYQYTEFCEHVSSVDIKILQFEQGFYVERASITDEDWIEFVLTVQSKSANGSLYTPGGVIALFDERSITKMNPNLTKNPNLN